MNLRDARSATVPGKVAPEPVGARYDGGSGAVLLVLGVKPYASGRRRWAVCLRHAGGETSEMGGEYSQASFSRAQRKLDAYAKRGGYRRIS